MKNAIISFGFGVCIILCFVIHSVITTKDVTANEAEKSLSIAVEQALGTMTIKPAYTLEDVDLLINELGTNIQRQLSSDSKLEINLVEPDWDKGAFKLEFTQKILTSNGNTSVATVEKTIHTENYEADTTETETENNTQ